MPAATQVDNLLTLTPSAFTLIEETAPELDGHVLLIGGGASGAATVVAPFVSQITQVCGSQAEGRQAQQLIDRQALDKMVVEVHGLAQLPYPDNHFAAVLVLDGSQQVEHLDAWLQDLQRLLQPGGVLILRSHLVPGTRLRGKKARLQREAGVYINAWCRLRSPQHRHFFSQDQWEDALKAADFEILQIVTASVTYDFAEWAAAFAPGEKDLLRLQAMLLQASEKAEAFLTPQFSGDRIRFRLPEITILARSQAKLDQRRQSGRTANLNRQVDER